MSGKAKRKSSDPSFPCFLLGILLLLAGTMVYVVDRPPGETYFLNVLPFKLSLYDTLPPLFGPMAAFLPHFFHVTAFILMTAGVMGLTKRSSIAICALWLTVHAGFEMGQKYGTQAAALVPEWFDGIFVLEKTRTYFLKGTYCHLDMAAVLAGCFCAYFFLRLLSKKRKNELPSKYA